MFPFGSSVELACIVVSVVVVGGGSVEFISSVSAGCDVAGFSVVPGPGPVAETIVGVIGGIGISIIEVVGVDEI